MEPIVLVLSVTLSFAIMGVVLYLVIRRPTAADAELKGALQLLVTQSSSQFANLSKEFDQRSANFQNAVDQRIEGLQKQWQDQNRTIGDRLKESGDTMRSVDESLGKLAEASKKIEQQAENVLRLEDLLKPQKIRGNLGETLMIEALRQVLPPSSFAAPYRFPDGLEVDAGIFMAEKVVPIDSKFPLENYRRALEDPDEGERRRARRQFAADVRKHVDAISQKYIRPGDGTFDFALMYVPAEAVYVEMLADGDEGSIADYALGKRVAPVSPHLLFAYLHTIALGLRGLEINKNAQDIVKRLADLTRDWSRVEVPFNVLGRHLVNAQTKFQDANVFVTRFGQRLRSVGSVAGVEDLQDETLADSISREEALASADIEGTESAPVPLHAGPLIHGLSDEDRG